MLTMPTRPAWLQNIENEDLPDLRGRRFRDTRFRNCRLSRVTNTVLERCSLEHCRFEPASLLDMLGVTLTLDCFTFSQLEMNQLGLDAFLYLLTSTAGNDEKRRLLRQLIAPDHLRAFEEQFDHLTRK